MASLDDIRTARLAKLDLLRERGMEPYPVTARPECDLATAASQFDELSKRKSVCIAGRVMALRGQGGAVFADFYDGTGKFQALLRKDAVPEDSFSLWKDAVDIGDFVEASGALSLTKQKEKTLQVGSWRMLAKTLRPLPEKWHGLLDVEERFRRRYLDLLMNEEVRRRFETRSRIVSAIRDFYTRAGYLEVETPRLQAVAGGATAEPFMTHYNALHLDLFLTIAQELYLKKLLIGGFNKVYEIGRKFRNEGIGVMHNPEFTMLESNEAYADAKSQRDFTERLFVHLASVIGKKEKIVYDGQEITIAAPFAVATFYDLLRRYARIANPESMGERELVLKAKELGIAVDAMKTKEKLLDAIYKKAVRAKLIQPTFIIEYPVEFNPFAKRTEGDPTLIDRFQLVIGGLELVNAFSELNNPLDQALRYEEQEKKRRSGEVESAPSDKEYLEAMEYGMPPNGGIGIGIDRLVMLFTDAKNIREVILFPTLRPR
ncbi:MAG: lysyl-tRNA synthetase, class II [Parcubacteria group bacterium Greene0416_79]|nr:MAG: lysyl-tRNA synthetase, class II [Parcubacteria group bacterium Greene0416_79]